MLELNVLGPLEVVRDGRRVEVGPGKQRAVLSLLIMHAGQAVMSDRILEAVWGHDGGGNENALWVTIARLRKLLDPDRNQNGDPTSSIPSQEAALKLWRGDPYQVVFFEEFAQGEIRRLGSRVGHRRDTDEARTADGSVRDAILTSVLKRHDTAVFSPSSSTSTATTTTYCSTSRTKASARRGEDTSPGGRGHRGICG